MLPFDTSQVAIMPGGMHILRISRGRQDVLKVWDTNHFSVIKRVSSGEVDSTLVFSRIIGCSPSGKLAELILEDLGYQRSLLVVLSLSTWAFSTVYSHTCKEKPGVLITRACFCGQDNHITFFLK